MATTQEKQTLMDDTRAVSFTHIERLYLQRSIDIHITQTRRSMAKEASPEVKAIRQNDIDFLETCKKRLGA